MSRPLNDQQFMSGYDRMLRWKKVFEEYSWTRASLQAEQAFCERVGEYSRTRAARQAEQAFYEGEQLQKEKKVKVHLMTRDGWRKTVEHEGPLSDTYRMPFIARASVGGDFSVDTSPVFEARDFRLIRISSIRELGPAPAGALHSEREERWYKEI